MVAKYFHFCTGLTSTHLTNTQVTLCNFPPFVSWSKRGRLSMRPKAENFPHGQKGKGRNQKLGTTESCAKRLGIA